MLVHLSVPVRPDNGRKMYQRSIMEEGASPERVRNTVYIQSAVDRVHKAGGGRVVVPPGNFRTGTIWLKSGVTLFLEGGAVLRAGTELEDFPERFPEDLISRRPFTRRVVGAFDAEDVGMQGMGTLEGSHGLRDHLPMGEVQPLGLQFARCRDVRVSGVTLRNAGSWMQQYLQCERVDIQKLQVWNHGNKTNDGLDLDGCRGVRVRDCVIDSHDDALVFKSTGPKKCEDILVEDCELRSNCHALKFGTESVGGFSGITVRRCHVGRSQNVLQLPMVNGPRPPITGCALECVDGGSMERIALEDLTVEDCLTPIFIKLGNRHERKIPGESFVGAGSISDVRIERMRVETSGPITSSITGYPGEFVENIVLRDISFKTRGGAKEENVMRRVPENSDGYPEVNMFSKAPEETDRTELPAWGLYLRHVKNLRMENVRGELLTHDPRPFLFQESTQNVERFDA